MEILLIITTITAAIHLSIAVLRRTVMKGTLSNYNNSDDYSNRSKTDLSNRSSYSTTAWKDKKTSTKKNTYNSYDDGYDDIYMNEQYDSDRYDRDSDYADGVDDAMDEFDEDY